MTSPRLTAPKIPQWVVPTTPTTAYAKAGSAVRDPETGERLALYDPAARATGVFLDPAMALTAPARLVTSATLNSLCMAVEGLVSRRGDPLADALLMQAVRTVGEWLPVAQQAPGEAGPRIHLMLAALMSGQGSDHTGGGVAQALSHALGPRSDVANGVVEAILLPHAVRFVAEVTPDRLAVLGAALGLVESSLRAVVEAVEDRLLAFETPTRLRDVGVSHEAMVDAVEHASDDWALTTASRVPTRSQALDLVAAAW
jgi:alcohol dehydrogenase class IV